MPPRHRPRHRPARRPRRNDPASPSVDIDLRPPWRAAVQARPRPDFHHQVPATGGGCRGGSQEVASAQLGKSEDQLLKPPFVVPGRIAAAPGERDRVEGKRRAGVVQPVDEERCGVLPMLPGHVASIATFQNRFAPATKPHRRYFHRGARAAVLRARRRRSSCDAWPSSGHPGSNLRESHIFAMASHLCRAWTSLPGP